MLCYDDSKKERGKEEEKEEKRRMIFLFLLFKRRFYFCFNFCLVFFMIRCAGTGKGRAKEGERIKVDCTAALINVFI